MKDVLLSSCMIFVLQLNVGKTKKYIVCLVDKWYKENRLS